MTRVPSTAVLRLELADDPSGLVNLVANPSGELGGWGWVTPLAGTAMDGDSSGLTYQSAAGGLQGFQTEDMPITAGRYAAASWRLLGGTPPPAQGLWVRNQFTWLDGSGAVISSTTPAPWHQYNDLGVVIYGPNQAPVGAVKFRLMFNLARDNTGNAINATPSALRLSQATVATAATPAELGTMTVNLVPDPSLELVPITTDWAPAGPNVAVARDTALRFDGAAAAKLTSKATSLRSNLVRNPNMLTLTGWQTQLNTTVDLWAATFPGSVGNALRLRGTDSGQQVQITQTVARFIPCAPGEQLLIRMWYAYGTGPTGAWTGSTSITLGVQWTDAAGAFIDGGTVTRAAQDVRVSATQGTWFPMAGALTVPTRAQGLRVTVNFDAGKVITSNMTAYVDQVILEKTTDYTHTPTYFDGDTPDTVTATYDWTGTAGDSTSTETVKLATTTTPGILSSSFAVRGGRQYTVSAYVMAYPSATLRSFLAQLTWFDNDHNPLATPTTVVTLGAPTATSTYTRFGATLTSPPAAMFATVAVYPSSIGPTESYGIDAVQLESGSTMGPFIIGQVTTGGLPYIPPVSWVDILGATHDISVVRQSLNVGTMSASILDANLDPSRADLLHPGRICRLMALPFGGDWQPLFTGAISQAEVTYDPQIPAPRRAKITMSAVDGLARLANIARAEGVGTVKDLPYVLEGCGVPWDINGSGNQVPTATVVAINESATALDQVAITRDSVHGVAWLDRFGVLRVYDTAPTPPPPTPTGYRDNVLADNPLAYYRFGESGGLQMADTTTNARHGTWFGTKAAALGLLVGDTNGATRQPGYAQGSWLDALTSSGVTLECLIQPTGAQANRGILARYDAAHCFLLWMNTSGLLAVRFYNTGGASVDLVYSTALTAGATYHVATTYVSGQARLYVNGVQVAQSTALSGALATGPGQSLEVDSYNNASFLFDGTIDEAAVYAGELPAARVAAHWAQATAPTLLGGDLEALAAVPVLDEGVYSDVDISFNTAQAINEVSLTYTRFNPNTGETEDVPYGPYTDAESVADWGPLAAEFRIQGIPETSTALQAFADAVLDANAVPVRRINSVVVPVKRPEGIAPEVALLDLEALCAVSNAAADTDASLRITSIEHRITTTTWLMSVGFTVDGQVATPTYTPAPGNSGGQTLGQLLRPVGEVSMFYGAKSAIPSGWLPLDGSTFAAASYPALATLLGSTTLPNMTDRFPVGAGTKALGTVGGAATVALTVAQMASHTHAAGTLANASDGSHQHDITKAASAGSSGSTISKGVATVDSTGTGGLASAGGHAHAISGSTATNAGTSSPVDITPPYRSLWFIIRAT